MGERIGNISIAPPFRNFFQKQPGLVNFLQQLDKHFADTGTINAHQAKFLTQGERLLILSERLDILRMQVLGEQYGLGRLPVGQPALADYRLGLAACMDLEDRFRVSPTLSTAEYKSIFWMDELSDFIIPSYVTSFRLPFHRFVQLCKAGVVDYEAKRRLSSLKDDRRMAGEQAYKEIQSSIRSVVPVTINPELIPELMMYFKGYDTSTMLWVNSHLPEIPFDHGIQRHKNLRNRGGLILDKLLMPAR